MAKLYQTRLETTYGQRIITQVVLTKDFSAPSEDPAGQFNQAVAREARKAIQQLDAGKRVVQPIDELRIETNQEGKFIKRHKKMEEHEAPLIFEEVFVKHRGTN